MSRWTDEDLDDIYDSTSGKCHLCGKKLARTNHGRTGARGTWHVDHSRPQARGGTDYLRNLKPACISCNCSKRDGSNSTVRARHGRSRAPLSRGRRRAAQVETGLLGGGLGWLAGRALLGPGAAILTGILGLALGSKVDPDKN